ncbi:hypothetical protein D3C76_1877170 [compost metagenome]
MSKIDIADVKAFMVQPGQIIVTFSDNLFFAFGGEYSLRLSRKRGLIQRGFPFQYDT